MPQIISEDEDCQFQIAANYLGSFSFSIIYRCVALANRGTLMDIDPKKNENTLSKRIEEVGFSN
jgi:hypothetical protein